MIPKHQRVVDATVQQVQARAVLLQRSLCTQGDDVPPALPVEQLRESVLGQRLCWIAEYVEGYPAAEQAIWQEMPLWPGEGKIVGGMRRIVYQVCAVVYATSATSATREGRRWAYPYQCQHTDLGRMLHAALWQFYQECEGLKPKGKAKELLRVAEAAKELRLARQTMHEWLWREQVRWVYEAEHDVIWLDRAEVHRLWQKKRGLEAEEPEI